jgi:hypothetical protein
MEWGKDTELKDIGKIKQDNTFEVVVLLKLHLSPLNCVVACSPVFSLWEV